MHRAGVRISSQTALDRMNVVGLAAISLAFVLACERAPKDGTSATTIVRYSVEPDPFPALSRSPGLRLCANNECELTTPVIAAVDRHRNVVLGGLTAGLVQIDSGGRFIRRLGRFGGGPGEYRWAVSGDFTETGEFTIFDTGNARLVGYDSAGAPTFTQRVEMPPPIVENAVVRGSELYIFSIPPAAQAGDSVAATILRYDGERQSYDTVVTARVASRAAKGTPFAQIPPLFSGNPVWDISEAREVFFSPASEYRIERYSADGALLNVTIVDLPSKRVRSDDVRREVAARLGKEPPPPQFRDQLDIAARNHARSFPAIDVIHAVGDSLLWVRRFAPAWADSARWDAFASSSQPFGFLMLPRNARILAGDRSRVLILDYDDLDVPVVTWYSLASGAP